MYANRVKETTATTGTGTYSLAGAATGYQGFVAGIGDGNTCVYVVEDGTNWEVGIGTVTDAETDTLSRDTILASSNSGSAVNWGAGEKEVFVSFPATFGTATYLVQAASNVLPNERVLAGTAKQIAVTDGGAGNSITVSAADTGNSTFFGSGAGANDDATTNNNAAFGKSALAAVTSGANNAAVGYTALAAVQTGADNTAVGSGALANYTGSFCVACGSGALNANVSGTNNVAVGYQAAYNTTANYNVAVGSAALFTNSGGIGNVAVGYQALTANTNGAGNIAIGNAAMKTNSSGSYSVGIGENALYLASTGSYNVGVGYQALRNTTAYGNVAVGYDALYTTSTGYCNTAVGRQAGYSQNTANQNVYLGYRAGYYNNTSNRLFIENSDISTPLIYGEFDNDIVKIHGELAVANVSEGGTARLGIKSAREVVALSGATTDSTINIPSGAVLLGVSFNVDVAVVDDGGDDTWSAAYTGGSSTALASGAAAALNTKVNTAIVPEVASATTNVRFTPNGGSFTAGSIEIVAYYWTLQSLANAA